MDKVNVTVSIPDEALFTEVMHAMRQSGLDVHKTFQPLGMLRVRSARLI